MDAQQSVDFDGDNGEGPAAPTWEDADGLRCPDARRRLPLYGVDATERALREGRDDPAFGEWLARRGLRTEVLVDWWASPSHVIAEMDRLGSSDDPDDNEAAEHLSDFVEFGDVAWFLDCERPLSGMTVNGAWSVLLASSCGDKPTAEESAELREAQDLFLSDWARERGMALPDKRAHFSSHRCDFHPHQKRAGQNWPATPGVYFIQTSAESDGPIKIGVAKNVRERLRGIQTAHPWPLRLLAIVPGDAAEEARMHARFEGARMSGEWFRATEDLLAFVQQIGVPS